ncbi:Protein of unknown function DUF1742 [Penicillium chermesinum]|uniref:DUF1742-domain-containing protein n=1 Tax=Penicillium chermesinum TaxID=63820 RepID=A0A9W9P635_9EURO|nr:Protein of unknown function DUF1742 [Penicillium chermesinum]KAJ5238502.1 Protein of unknown function DUF1742 [Penicillium chermesinum]KAJ6164157.1 Protein of unknown function DUF1742 [Penicillium chermesinum]
MALPNVYHLRRVADTSSKACLICFKPSTSVLITPDNKDFFYVCPSHLQDRNFCSAIVDTEGEAARLKEEKMAKEIEQVKKEYDEKQRRKKDRQNKSDKDKDEKEKDESKTKEKEDSGSKANDEKERDDKIDSIRKAGSESKPDNSPRVFALHKTFYQMRIDRLKGIEMAKRNQERMKNPSLFPSVPKGDIS